MNLVTVIGTQWGDEGKGKIVDLLAEKADYIVRFQGGNNAGHTLVIGDKTYKLNLLPSGIVRDHTISCIGNGVVLDPFALMNEIKTVADQGLEVTPRKLVISESCHLILPIHKILDGGQETARGDMNLGTTKKGIGPAYEDKVARRGIRVADLQKPEILKSRLESLHAHHNIPMEGVYNDLMAIAERVLSFAGNVGLLLSQAATDNKNIMFEGAQGSLLDIDHGTYPFVTSSNTVAGQTSAGSGFGGARKSHIIGLAKAYTTRVGTGPFPTEQQNEIGDYLGEKGHEFGTVTGRKRQCGWFDAALVKHACQINDVDSIALTKLDVLDGLKEIKICVGYDLDGKRLQGVPAHYKDWENIIPVYETMDGWDDTTVGVQNMDALPLAAKAYIDRLQGIIGVPISIVSTSPERDDTILRQDFFA